ncbi:hypothetical protein, partial [Pseudogracilibacillus sp. SO30301A]|uniref:hypothetical protein n=1 Tax=Pseudogracilibacillus sp. SO30301A TaxID=3098291 RepID=UPI00300E0873
CRVDFQDVESISKMSSRFPRCRVDFQEVESISKMSSQFPRCRVNFQEVESISKKSSRFPRSRVVSQYMSCAPGYGVDSYVGVILLELSIYLFNSIAIWIFANSTCAKSVVVGNGKLVVFLLFVFSIDL